MRVVFTEEGWDDYQHWIRTDAKVLGKLNDLIEDSRRNLFTGLGKPEPLRGDLKGWWSRRIAGDHRLVYAIEGKDDAQRIIVSACRYHHE